MQPSLSTSHQSPNFIYEPAELVVMITDARALQPEFVPGELHHREGEVDALTTSLDAIVDGESGRHSFIFGPSGTGKTVLAQYAVNLLEREAFDVATAYVNCITNSTPTSMLYELTTSAGLAADLRRQGHGPARFVDRIKDADRQVVAILDEVDILTEYRVLASLADIPNLTLLMVCVDEHALFSAFEEPIRSRFSSHRTITLTRYSTVELTSILKGRVRHGLESGVIHDAEIEYIADLAAGDARAAIAILRSAVESIRAGEADAPVSVDLIDASQEDAREDIRRRKIRELDTEKRLLYDIVLENPEISAGDLREKYERRSVNHVADSTRRRYLSRLEEYDLIEGVGRGRGKRYQAL